ncbi:MAG TPA: insulinase family protein [Planctomycetales bacterium]|nr:insulinase family protein [Planctomycetales bacterium]
MPFHSHKLPNGLQVIGETSPSARSASLGFFVRTGARDETPEVSGVTHFLEHMVFKGTPNRTYLDVNRDFDRIGADYNAFTSEENTVFHAAVLPEYLPQAVDILSDILRPSLRDEDFNTEKNVIIEEIGMYEDQPGSCAYENAKRLFFADHRLANSILGTVQSITDLRRDQMHAYFQRRYIGPNITVAVAGRFDWPELIQLVEKHCGAWQSGPVGRDCVRETPGSGGFKVVTKEKVTQEHVILMGGGPPADSPLRHAADLLSMIVGDDSGSRLYWALVDPGLAESADCSYHEYEGTGSFYTSFSGEPEEAESNLEIVLEVLRDTGRDGVTEEELQQARNKILSRVVRASERPKGRMIAVGMHWIYQHEYRTMDDELKAYEAVTTKTIREVLDRYPIDRVSTLALGPLTSLKQPKRNGRK